ncbi:MAG: oxidoreductase [Bdellovibrio sp.]|nr:oxidoreductase [Bdellovibrio sp.]
MKTVLILGATGLVGRNLVKICCASDCVDVVKIFIRKKLSDDDKIKLFGPVPKLKIHVIDFDLLSNSEEYICGDIVLSALGSTIKKAKTKERFYHIDHDYNVAFAKLAHKNAAQVMGIISSVGAKKNSPSFYLKTKGMIEHDLAGMNWPKFIAVRPSFLIGERDKDRFGEKIGIGVFKSLRPVMIGGLKKYAPISAGDVAQALVDLCLTDQAPKNGLEYERKIIF